MVARHGHRMASPNVGHRAQGTSHPGARACCADRIRNLKDTSATNLPLRSFDKNQLWSGAFQV